jgi:hypothetical protein
MIMDANDTTNSYTNRFRLPYSKRSLEDIVNMVEKEGKEQSCTCMDPSRGVGDQGQDGKNVVFGIYYKRKCK